MVRADLPACERTELGSFAEPWAGGQFLARLRLRNGIGLVATSRWDDAVLGHVVYTLHRDHLTLDRLAVAPRVRLCGVGRALLERLQHKAVTHRRERVEAVVPEENVPAQVWLRACGWRAIDLTDDGIVFAWPAPAVRWPTPDLTQD